MRAIAGAGERREPLAASAVIVGSLVVLAFTVLTGFRTYEVAGTVTVVVILVAGYRALLRWPMLVLWLLLVILFIPIRRYKLPGSLPFDLEPYRLIVALVVVAWLTSLLIDPRVRLRRLAFGAPLALVIGSVLASEVANPERVTELGSEVAKSLTFFASFLLVFALIVSIVRTPAEIERIVRVLVAGGAALAAFALVERRTGFNVFNELHRAVPLLRFEGAKEAAGVTRFGRLRVYGPAEHPIALGAAFVVILPLALYLIRSSVHRRWWAAAAGLLVIGTLATASRTAIVMLVVVVLVFLWLRPAETRRLWPAAIPILLAIHLAVPGAIGTIRASFNPRALLAEQSSVVKGNELLANGRLTDLGPSLDQFEQRPLFGQGFGTRIVGFEVENVNAPILDNQWLGTLLETGLLGVLGWLWLFGSGVRRFGRAAKLDPTPQGWLLAGLAASVAAFAVGMLTYDAFSFVQVTFVIFIMLGLGAVLLTSRSARS